MLNEQCQYHPLYVSLMLRYRFHLHDQVTHKRAWIPVPSCDSGSPVFLLNMSILLMVSCYLEGTLSSHLLIQSSEMNLNKEWSQMLFPRVRNYSKSWEKADYVTSHCVGVLMQHDDGSRWAGNAEVDNSQLIFPQEFHIVQTLRNSEVHMLLEHGKQQNGSAEDEQELSEVFMKTWSYTAYLSHFKNRETIVSAHSLLLQKKLHQFELACLSNLCPETTEEPKAVIPSLEGCLEMTSYSRFRPVAAFYLNLQTPLCFERTTSPAPLSSRIWGWLAQKFCLRRLLGFFWIHQPSLVLV